VPYRKNAAMSEAYKNRKKWTVGWECVEGERMQCNKSSKKVKTVTPCKEQLENCSEHILCEEDFNFTMAAKCLT
jgi:hypothetical protein